MQEKILLAEIAIKERLNKEHIDLEPRIITNFWHGQISNVELIKDKDYIFGNLIITFGSNGYTCEDSGKYDLRDSILLQNLISTIVEETLDEYLLED